MYKYMYIYISSVDVYYGGGRAFARVWKSDQFLCKRPPTTFSRLAPERAPWAFARAVTVYVYMYNHVPNMMQTGP